MTYQQLVEKARSRRRAALTEVRMPQINLFWDGAHRERPRHTVAAQMTDVRIRMGRRRMTLGATLV